MPTNKKNADELIEEIGSLETVEEVEAAAEGEKRVTVQKAAEDRIAELSEAQTIAKDDVEPPAEKADEEPSDEDAADEVVTDEEGEPVEVSETLLQEVHSAIEHKVNQSAKRRGMSVPSDVDRELARVKEELEKII